jgi:ankyrin repeat protein
LEAVTALVQQNPGFVSVRSEKGETPLHVAIDNGCEEVVRFLLDKKADANAPNEYGFLPLDYAVETEKTTPSSGIVYHVTFSADIANSLLSHGAVVEDRMLLHIASSGSVPAVQWLLDHGAHVNARNEHGGTALHDAAWMGDYEMVALLVARGADVNLERSDGCVGTPLHEAACHGHTRIAELLLAHGANVNAINKDDHTPLYLAIQENGGGMTVTTQTTVYGGAEGNQSRSENSDYRNANDEVIQLLRKHGGHE